MLSSVDRALIATPLDDCARAPHIEYILLTAILLTAGRGRAILFMAIFEIH